MSKVPSLHSTIGLIYIGVVFSSGLLGVVLVQSFLYFKVYCKRDSWRMKLMVATVLFIEVVHQAIIMHTVYFYSISSWGNTDSLRNIVWSMIIEVPFNGASAFIVQSFLVLRIWYLSLGSVWLTGLNAILVLAEFACVIAFTVLAIPMKTYQELAQLKYLSIGVNSLAALGDIAITTTLCIRLYRSRTIFRKTNCMINWLILFTMNTGMLTCLCAIASMVSMIVAGETFLYIAFYFCISRLYSNCLLAGLNSRKAIGNIGRGIRDTNVIEDLDSSESLKFQKADIETPVSTVTIAQERRQTGRASFMQIDIDSDLDMEIANAL